MKHNREAELKAAGFVGLIATNIGGAMLFIGVFSAGVSVTGVGLMLFGEFARRKIAEEMVYQHYALRDQTPNEDTLIAQLQTDGHVVVAHFMVNGQTNSAVVASGNRFVLKEAKKKQQFMGIEDVLKLADNGEVFFSGGPIE